MIAAFTNQVSGEPGAAQSASERLSSSSSRCITSWLNAEWSENRRMASSASDALALAHSTCAGTGPSAEHKIASTPQKSFDCLCATSPGSSRRDLMHG
jgi:hypothetical protein